MKIEKVGNTAHCKRVRPTRATFTYSFPSVFNSTILTPASGGYFAADGTFISSTSTLSQYAQSAALTQAFSMWSSVANISFADGNSVDNHISIAYWNTKEDGRGSGTTYGQKINGATTFNTASNFWIFLNKNHDINDPNGPSDFMITNPTVSNWGIWNIAHELGHPLLGDGVTNGVRHD